MPQNAPRQVGQDLAAAGIQSTLGSAFISRPHSCRNHLAREYLAALQKTPFAALAPLQDAGVGGHGLAIGPAVASIRVSHDRRFDLDPDGDATAFIVPVRVGNPLTPEASDPIDTVRHGAIVDLLAFSPAFPNHWALRTDAASWLGSIEPQLLMPEPVPVWRNPLHWLQANCHGLVLLTEDRLDQYRVLTVCDSILAEDEQHAAELRYVLQHPWLAPPVYVRRGREVRNAA